MQEGKETSKGELVIEIIENLDLFKGISKSVLLKLAELFEEKIYSKDEFVFKEGSAGDSMMVVVSGEVRVSQTEETVEEALVVLKKGDLFGEMAMLEELPRTATVISNTNVILLEIKRVDFLNFLSEHSDAGVEILLKLSKILSSRLREADSKLRVFVSLTKWL